MLKDVNERTERRRAEAKHKALVRVEKHRLARIAHNMEKKAFNMEMELMQEQMDQELEEFEAQVSVCTRGRAGRGRLLSRRVTPSGD